MPTKPPSHRKRANLSRRSFMRRTEGGHPSPEFWILTPAFSPILQNEPNFHRGGPVEDQKRETNPISAHPIRQNEPNLPHDTLAPHQLCKTNPIPVQQTCETNPIYRAEQARKRKNNDTECPQSYPHGGTPKNISSWKSYDNPREEIIVGEGNYS